jgi:hypothetical protein
MNLSQNRDDIAAALNGVEGITGFSEPPNVFKAGAAWPLLGSLSNAMAPGVFAATWYVHLVTGGTPTEALAFIDEHLADVVDALGPVAWVEQIDPVALPTNSGNYYAVQLTLTRE